MIRNGLRYGLHSFTGGEEICIYYPSQPFRVDGIDYGMDRQRITVRPMVELLGDDDFCTGQPQCHCDPITDTELDRWVRRA